MYCSALISNYRANVSISKANAVFKCLRRPNIWPGFIPLSFPTRPKSISKFYVGLTFNFSIIKGVHHEGHYHTRYVYVHLYVCAFFSLMFKRFETLKMSRQIQTVNMCYANLFKDEFDR